jgi:hypothetical protein
MPLGGEPGGLLSHILPIYRHCINLSRQYFSKFQGRLNPKCCGLNLYPEPSMASTQITDILRFLSQDAKVPLATALGKVVDLQKANMTRYAPSFFNEILSTNRPEVQSKSQNQISKLSKKSSKMKKSPNKCLTPPSGSPRNVEPQLRLQRDHLKRRKRILKLPKTRPPLKWNPLSVCPSLLPVTASSAT